MNSQPLSKKAVVLFSILYPIAYIGGGLIFLIISIILSDNVALSNTFPIVVMDVLYGGELPPNGVNVPAFFPLAFIAIIVICIIVLWIKKSWIKSLIPLIFIIPLVFFAFTQMSAWDKQNTEISMAKSAAAENDAVLQSINSKEIFYCGSNQAYIQFEGGPLNNAYAMYAVYNEWTSGNGKIVAKVLLAELLANGTDYYIFTHNSEQYINYKNINPTNADYSSKLDSCVDAHGKTFSQLYNRVQNLPNDQA